MKLAIISTMYNLEFCEQGDIYVCLAHLALKNKEYLNFFKDKSKKGKYIILDNGVAENNPVLPMELIELANEIEANEVIAPNIPHNVNKTLHAAGDFINLASYFLDAKIKIMGVIRGGNITDCIDCHDAYMKMKQISSIGLPFAEFNFFSDYKREYYMHNRFVFWVSLRDAPKLKPIHLLGLYNPNELSLYESSSEIRSCSSDIAVLYGVQKQKFATVGINAFFEFPENLDLKTEIKDAKTKQIINHNIAILKALGEA